jgi:hypothetical protein
MKNLLRLEELAQLAIAIAGLYYQSIHLPGWLWPILFLAPDLGMCGYLINPQAGSITYNLAHHKGIALALAAAGWRLNVPVLLLAGLLLYAHSSFDRILGYGLKYADAFRHTHLGWLPEGRKQNHDS